MLFLFINALTLVVGLYITFWQGIFNTYLIAATIIATWVIGFNSGEAIEKVQSWIHWWKLQQEPHHSRHNRNNVAHLENTHK